MPWDYVVSSIAWSFVGLGLGAVLGELGWDINSLVRHSGRRHHRHDDS